MTGTLVMAEQLGVSFGTTPIIDELDLSVLPGTELALTGRSGSGKTTVLLVLAGLLAPSAGSIRWPGLSDDRTRRAGQIGLIFQAPSLLPELTAAENVTLPLRLRGGSRAEAERAAADALDAVGVGDAAGTLPFELSGGQQQRVAVARALAGRPLLLLADEPTGALDRVNAVAVLAVLRDHARAGGGALIVATHDEDLAGMLAGRLRLDERRLAHSHGGGDR